ncbi:hypothetical protein ARMGADRAFT_1031434 [Armillaria gallica]|uniref:Uncharacterized protein n=1 Tax=Armillaria gallica TaxID=47427 RepID=A0A2H3DWY8_ARMGA|nr:hypothetical protein ARMGADRAFT_1031434 [Armillaria gallica]
MEILSNLEGVPRQGELKVFGQYSFTCEFKVIANHRYPIPDGLYTLIGNRGAVYPRENDMLHWVAGKMQDGKFRKCSVFSMADDGERRKLLGFYRTWVTPGMRPDVMPYTWHRLLHHTCVGGIDKK